MFKLNLHAHSRYSDGAHTVEEMFAKYKELGFPVAVLTDHVYSGDNYSLTLEKFNREIVEAEEASLKVGIPYILGAEFCVQMSEECLIFGREAILELLKRRDANISYDNFESKKIMFNDFLDVRERHNCAIILAHPHLTTFEKKGGHLTIDAYEKINSSQDYFRFGEDTRPIPWYLEDKIGFCNSDAHQFDSLFRCYNMTPYPITTEEQLIAFIKDGIAVRHVNNLK